MKEEKKQSLLASFINYIGVILGALSTFFIYPKNLELYGIYGFLTNAASILTPFVTLGFGTVLLRYFPFFKNHEEKNHGFLAFIFVGYLVGIVIFILCFVLLLPIIKNYYTVDSKNSVFLIFILPLTILYVLFDLFTHYCINYRKLVVPTLLNALLKLYLPVIFLATIGGILNYMSFIILVCLYYIVIIIVIVIYIYSANLLHVQIRKQIFSHALVPQMVRFALFSILTGVSSLIALRIDSVMVTFALGVEENGKFILAAFISNAVYIPANSISDILFPRVANLSKDSDKLGLLQIYQKSMINMLIPTLWIGLCTYLSFPYLTQLMPNTEKVSTISLCLAFLLLARLIDAGTGVNHHILAFSKFYRIEMYLMLCMAFINVSLNYFFIPIFGIAGAALATFISVSLFNVAKSVIVFWNLGLHPFTLRIIYLLAAVPIVFFINSLLPDTGSMVVNIILHCSSVSLILFGFIVYFKISPELIQLISQNINLGLGRIKDS
ncbi:MAG: polysaccharide biosynthesis C-terminal domain-containing protein [Bacteroidota bacterium]|nr:polysaccharide biosynthesis C-terminal domain-containing protein [Bacteroidota bacterium]